MSDLVDEHGIHYTLDAAGGRVAHCWQTGYGCQHAELHPTREEMRAAGYTRFRRDVFIDVSGLCDTCKAKRKSAPPKKRTGRR